MVVVVDVVCISNLDKIKRRRNKSKEFGRLEWNGMAASSAHIPTTTTNGACARAGRQARNCRKSKIPHRHTHTHTHTHTQTNTRTLKSKTKHQKSLKKQKKSKKTNRRVNKEQQNRKWKEIQYINTKRAKKNNNQAH